MEGLPNLLASLVSSMPTRPFAGASKDSTANGFSKTSKPRLAPDPTDALSPSDPSFWNAWIDEVKERLKNDLPIVDSDSEGRPVPPLTKLLQQSITTRKLARTTLQQATELFDELSHQDPPPIDPKELEKAKQLVASAQASFDGSDQALLEVASAIVDQIRHFLSCCYDDKDLLLYCAMTAATPAKLSAWCAQGDEETQQLLELFEDPLAHGLLLRFFQSGGPRHAEYGRAAQVYRQLIDASRSDVDAVLDRLALATALELCCDLDDTAHSVEHRPIDPFRRYHHYRDAYLAGELDPAFATLSSWEMRMAINSDASESELQWGRDCLKNYRPDIVTMSDPQWRYCWIVRQDVAYKDPDWYKPERSYDQILSGGGECGPRAWYGRFICKAFGIPTWGVRQPGHAAMSRWTSAGEWKICLGAGFQVSDWDGRCGNDFELETKARIRLNCDASYLRRVTRLELLAMFCGESDKALRSSGEPDVDSLWYSLSMLQRRIISTDPKRIPSICEAREMTQVGLKPQNDTIVNVDDAICIPASSGAIDKANASKVQVMPSFLGGQQLFLGKDGEAEYDIVLDVTSVSTFKVSLVVCTVHRIQEPLCVIVSSDDNDVPDTVLQLSLPYTVGMWQETEPVEADFYPKSRLTLKRQEPMFGVSITTIKLVPVVDEYCSQQRR